MFRWFAVNSEDNAVDERDYFGAFRFAVFPEAVLGAGGRANLVNVGCRVGGAALRRRASSRGRIRE
jgi:hypothetical protein